jgi:uncharacterized protein
MNNFFLRVFSVLACLMLPATTTAQSAAAMPVVQLNAGMHLIKAEVAQTDAHRTRGLMFREQLGTNEGMLFVYEQSTIHCMWMKNTLIPLSVAFIDAQGIIINIEDMQPQKLDSHCTKKPATYSLEMNQGWFKQRSIKPGMKIGGIAPSERSGATPPAPSK